MNKLKETCTIFLSLALVLSTATAAFADKKKLTEHDFIMGEPDTSVEFPQAAFEQAKVLKKEKNYSLAEHELLKNLDKARLSARGTDKLGKYLVRLNNVLFDSGKDKEAAYYGEIAAKILTKNSYKSNKNIGWRVNVQSYLAMGYSRMRKYTEAIEWYKEAIDLAESAPPGKVSESWINTLKIQKKHTEQLTQH